MTLSRKPLLFKSFTGLSVRQFDDVFKEIESRYSRYEVNRLSYDRKNKRKRKRKRERAVRAGRHFKLVPKDRVVRVLVYYRLYNTYTLIGFLLDLDQGNICRDIQKIEGLIENACQFLRNFIMSSRGLKQKKRLKSISRVLCITDYSEQQIPRPPKNK